MQKMKFEDALKKLEAIVNKLEKGDIPLEEALKSFEEGIKLSRICTKILEDAEKRVEVLTKDEDGRLKTEPFE